MADQQTPKETTSNDEIDLGQLFNMIGRGFKNFSLYKKEFSGFVYSDCSWGLNCLWLKPVCF